jgi:GNAT superfamily N-acetyltransferase
MTVGVPSGSSGRLAIYRGGSIFGCESEKGCGRPIMTSELETMNVRAANEADVDALAQIWHDGWHDAHARIVPAELARLRTLKSFRDRLHADLGAVRILQTGGSIVGLSMVRGAELYQFYVAESSRGSGAAAVLMADVEAQLAARGSHGLRAQSATIALRGSTRNANGLARGRSSTMRTPRMDRFR